MSLNVIAVKPFLCIVKISFWQIYVGSWTRFGGFQFLLILDLWGISFPAVIVFGLGKNLLFKYVLGHCALRGKSSTLTWNDPMQLYNLWLHRMQGGQLVEAEQQAIVVFLTVPVAFSSIGLVPTYLECFLGTLRHLLNSG